MSFPTTTLRDNFDRANADPTSNPMSSGDSWAQACAIGTATANRLKIVSNQAKASAATFCSDYDTTSYGPDSEVWATIASLGAWTGANEVIALYARVVNPALASCTGYELEVDANGTWTVWNMASSSSFASLGTFTQAVAAGDSVGMAVTGTGATVTIEAWYKASGGSWVSLGTKSDSGGTRRTTAGVIALEIHRGASNDPIADDFGGGTVVTAANYTVINGTLAQLVNVNAGGTDVDALSYKTGVLLSLTELATVASTAGVIVTKDGMTAQLGELLRRSGAVARAST